MCKHEVDNQKKRNRLLRYRGLFFTCAAINMIVIFYFSSQNSVESAALSDLVVKPVMNVVEEAEIVNRPLNIFDYFNFSESIRNVMHFLEYLSLGIWVQLLLTTFSEKKIELKTILICGIYACSDEIHQIFIPGRGASIGDVIIDISGSLIGVLIRMMQQSHFVTSPISTSWRSISRLPRIIISRFIRHR